MKRGLKYIVFLISILMLLTGCTDEDKNSHISEEGILITLTLHVSNSLSSTKTRSLTEEDENSIQTLHVLALTSNNGDWLFDYEAEIENKIVTENNLTLTIKVREMPTQQQFVIIANGEDEWLNALPERYENIIDIENRLLCTSGNGEWPVTNGDNTTFTPLPMYARTDAQTVSNSSNNTIGTYPMLRMVARIDVTLKSDIDNFILEEAALFNYKTAGYISYANSLFSGDRVGMAAVPAAGDHTGDPVLEPTVYYQADVTDDPRGAILRSIYTFESPAITNEDEKTRGTALVVGGYYNNHPTKTYYRIDLKTSDDNSQHLSSDLLRNHSYRVEIQSVNSEGYQDPVDAYQGTTQLTAEVTQWELSNQLITGDGQHILKVNQDYFEFRMGTEALILEASTDYTISTAGYPAGLQIHPAEIEYTPAVNPGEEWLTLTDQSGEGNGSLERIITLTATNSSTVEREAKIHVQAGNMVKIVRVVQPGMVPMLNATAPRVYNYTGGTHEYSIESNLTLIKSSGNENIPVEWAVEFSTNRGTTWTTIAPEWLTSFTSSGTGGTETTYMADVAAFARSEHSVSVATPKGSPGSPYDLSTQGGETTMNTANCYIVNSPGYYQFPLVYGNAIRNGQDNPESYRPSGTLSGNFLTQFLRHDDQPITGPYIYNQSGGTSITPYDAIIVWMDAPNLITQVALSGNSQSVTFEVAQASAMQGNALIAVRDRNQNILWSWHIWVTALVDAEDPIVLPTKNHEGHIYNFMQFDLGWYAERQNLIFYGEEPRNVVVKITQVGLLSPLSQTFTIRQNNGITSHGGYGTYWQWGRKDPMPPSDGTTSTINKVLYGNIPYQIQWGPVSIGTSIRNPATFYRMNSSTNWCSSFYTNLWSAHNTVMTYNDNPVIKTVYDPSPVGFKIPPSNAWTGFTTTGNNSTQLSQFHVEGSFDNGWNFYLYSRNNNPDYANYGTTFYPMNGARAYNSGNLSGLGSFGDYWSAIPAHANSGCYFTLGSYYLNIKVSQTSSYGFGIRCIAE